MAAFAASEYDECAHSMRNDRMRRISCLAVCCHSDGAHIQMNGSSVAFMLTECLYWRAVIMIMTQHSTDYV